MNRYELVSKIEKASFKQVLFFCGLLPALFSFPIAYFVSPTAQENITNIPVGAMVFMAWTSMCLILVWFGAVVYRDYVVYSPRVYRRLSDGTYVVIAKNRLFRELLDLFVEFTEKKLRATWNRQTEQVEQNKEEIEGLKSKVASLNEKIATLEVRLQDSTDIKIHFDQYKRNNQENFANKWRIITLERRVGELTQKIENMKKTENVVPVEELEEILSRLFEVEEEIRKLKGE